MENTDFDGDDNGIIIGRHEIPNVDDIKNFIIGGKAIFTLQNEETGNRITYRIEQPDDTAPLFIRFMNGSNNEGDYKFIGTIFTPANNRNGSVYSLSLTKKWDCQNTPAGKGIAFLFKKIFEQNQALPEPMKFYHEGRCCRCGRLLTVPQSLSIGLGPTCAKKQ